MFIPSTAHPVAVIVYGKLFSENEALGLDIQVLREISPWIVNDLTSETMRPETTVYD
jgi:hypothetical protein